MDFVLAACSIYIYIYFVFFFFFSLLPLSFSFRLITNGKHNIMTDMWAVGAILAELFTLCPIFPGQRWFINFFSVTILDRLHWTSWFIIADLVRHYCMNRIKNSFIRKMVPLIFVWISITPYFSHQLFPFWKQKKLNTILHIFNIYLNE